MDTFARTHGILIEQNAPVEGELAADMPEPLKDLLRRVGANAYANGFFRFVAPQLFGRYFELVNLEASECYSFLKCGFGQVLFYHHDQYKVLNPVFNTVDILGERDELSFVMDVLLCDRPALETSFLIDVYEEAVPRLGAPDVDEMYTFVPALRLGGSRNSANVRKARMAVEMPILLQV